MRHKLYKWFWMWDFDKEEKWLNEMAAKGLGLVSVGFCKYEFEDTAPGEYGVRIQFLKRGSGRAENAKYIEFLEDTGIEHVGSYSRWIYLRKKSADGKFELFSDNESRARHLLDIMAFIIILAAFNLYLGGYNLFLYILLRRSISLICILNFIIVALLILGIAKLFKKRRRILREKILFE